MGRINADVVEPSTVDFHSECLGHRGMKCGAHAVVDGMHHLIRRGRALELAALTVLAALSALALNNLVAAHISGLPTAPVVELRTASSAADPDAPARWAAVIGARDLFDSAPMTPEPDAQPEAPADPPGSDGACAGPDVPMALIATMVADEGGSTRAVIEAGAEPRLVGVGALIGDHRVVEIHRQRAMLQVGGRLACLQLGERPRRATRAPKAAARAKYDPELVRKLGPDRYAIDRAALDAQLSDLRRIGRQIRVRPELRQGRTVGFRVTRIDRRGVFHAIGLRQDDILSGVDGVAVDSPTKALELFDRLGTARDVTVDVIRRGRPVTLSYDIR